MPEAGVRADDEEQVGEAVHRGALVGLHAVLGEVVGEADAVAAVDLPGDRQVGGVEAGGHDQHVDLALGAVRGDDAAPG